MNYIDPDGIDFENKDLYIDGEYSTYAIIPFNEIKKLIKDLKEFMKENSNEEF